MLHLDRLCMYGVIIVIIIIITIKADSERRYLEYKSIHLVENIGVVLGISLLSCLQAELHVFQA